MDQIYAVRVTAFRPNPAGIVTDKDLVQVIQVPPLALIDILKMILYSILA